MSINKKILNYIKENDIIQSELCKKLGYTQANLSRILNSDDIKFSQLEKICSALSLPVSYFMNENGTYSSEEIKTINKQIETLDSNYTVVLNKLEEEQTKHHQLLNVVLDVMVNYKNSDRELNETLAKNLHDYFKKMINDKSLPKEIKGE